MSNGKSVSGEASSSRDNWKPIASIAALVALGLSVFGGIERYISPLQNDVSILQEQVKVLRKQVATLETMQATGQAICGVFHKRQEKSEKHIDEIKDAYNVFRETTLRKDFSQDGRIHDLERAVKPDVNRD